MTWPIAFVICFALFIAAFLFIYIKEYRREENIMKMSKSSFGALPLVYVDPPAKKQKKTVVEAPKPDKKKDMN
jgi:hypothetical protein